MSAYNKLIFENTVKIRANNVHKNEELIQLLTLNHIKHDVEGINSVGKGKFFEIKCKNKETYQRLLTNGLQCCHHNECYLAEPAYEEAKTRIKANNVPIGESGRKIRQYIERNGYRVVHYTRYMMDEKLGIESGIMSFIAEKLEGWKVLPYYTTIFGRRIGLMHDEQREAEEDSEADSDSQPESENERQPEPVNGFGPTAPPPSDAAWGAPNFIPEQTPRFDFGPATPSFATTKEADDGFKTVRSRNRGTFRAPLKAPPTSGVALSNRFDTAGMEWDPYDSTGIIPPAKISSEEEISSRKKTSGRRNKKTQKAATTRINDDGSGIVDTTEHTNHSDHQTTTDSNETTDNQPTATNEAPTDDNTEDTPTDEATTNDDTSANKATDDLTIDLTRTEATIDETDNNADVYSDVTDADTSDREPTDGDESAKGETTSAEIVPAPTVETNENSNIEEGEIRDEETIPSTFLTNKKRSKEQAKLSNAEDETPEKIVCDEPTTGDEQMVFFKCGQFERDITENELNLLNLRIEQDVLNEDDLPDIFIYMLANGNLKKIRNLALAKKDKRKFMASLLHFYGGKRDTVMEGEIVPKRESLNFLNDSEVVKNWNFYDKYDRNKKAWDTLCGALTYNLGKRRLALKKN